MISACDWAESLAGFILDIEDAPRGAERPRILAAIAEAHEYVDWAMDDGDVDAADVEED